ncbi:uncharacterized protein LOC26535679 [Drosophila yakuba]|uniref:Uncharacterized protein n=1 Tax=Drosophila yakuba TaxID=7245 RepID=A0A0R1ED44_DROYA|nr:uncharacterized protein LOC26535679 [Drosophila yakuba]KRK06734.1 uncharacterized protein Dyak_GE28498 [Drosophila yakuba]
MKITIAILGLFAALICSLQSPTAACDVQAVYNQTMKFCEKLTFVNIFLCAGLSYGVSNEKVFQALQSQQKFVCAIPFFGEICKVCDFATIISNNQNATISSGNSTAGATRTLNLEDLTL